MSRNDELIISFNEEISNNDLFIRRDLSHYDRNSILLVYPTHYAILIKDGVIYETLQEGKHYIFDKKDDKHTRQVEVIYMSKTAKLQALWGTRNRMNMRDPLTNLRVEVGINGEYEVQIKEPRKFYLLLAGVDRSFNLDTLKERLLGRILNTVEPVCAKYMRQNNLSFTDFAEHRNEIAKLVKDEIKEMFDKDYGLNLYSFSILNCYIPDNYIRDIEKFLEHKRQIDEDRLDRQSKIYESERISENNFNRTLILNRNGEKSYNNLFCTHCGEKYTYGSMFCSKCGNRLTPPTKKCPLCSKINDGENIFCNYCGTKL